MSPSKAMELHELFRSSDLAVGFDPVDKWDAIERLVERLREDDRLPEDIRASVLDAVLARERSMSTGMERGIAIPHAAVDGIDGVVAQLGIITREDGLAFESVDAQPARLVALLIIPRAQKLLHISTLANVARVLGSEAVREALFNAEDSQTAWEALGGAPAGG